MYLLRVDMKGGLMNEHVKAKLFTHGGSQAVRLPKAFRFEGAEVRIRKEGQRVILEPIPQDWADFWNRIDQIGGESFPYPPEQPTAPKPVKW